MPDLIDRVLGYVDAPWKIFSIVVLALLGLASVMVWEKRADIAESILHSTVTPRLELTAFAKNVPPLMQETGADVAILMRIELATNLNRIVAGIRRDDPLWKPPSGPRPLFTGADAETIVRLLEGAAQCLDFGSDSPLLIEREFAALGITRGCVVSVPPIADVLVGAFGIGWKTAPDAPHEAGAKAAMRRVALRLATW